MDTDKLFSTIKQDDVKKVKLLLQTSRKNIDSFTDRDGYTALHYAIHKNCSLKMIQLLLNLGADVNIQDKFNSTPLLKACRTEDYSETVKYLIGQGAKANVRCNFGMTLLHHAAGTRNNLSTVRFLVEHRADVKSRCKYLSTPLHEASGTEDNLKVVRLLFYHGAEVDAKSHSGITPLHCAAEATNNSSTVQFLIEVGANINATDYKEETPLHRAVRVKHNFTTVKSLLELGANVNFKSKYSTPLHEACQVDNNLETIKMLLSRGAEVNAKFDSGKTLLHCSVGLKNSFDVTKLLTEHGAEVNATNDHGETPLHLAVQKKDNSRTVKILLELGADTNATEKKRGDTPVHFAVRSNENIEILKLLVKHGADINVYNSLGYTPLDIAFKFNFGLVEVLLNLGADIIRADVNSQDEHGMTPFYKSILVGDKSLLIQLLDLDPDFYISPKLIADIISCNDDIHEIMGVIIPKHLVKLKVLHLVDDTVLSMWRVNSDKMRNFLNECKKEVRKLKSELIFSDRRSTFADLLTKNIEFVAVYSSLESVVERIMKTEIEKEFPIYSSMLKGKILRGQRLSKLLDKCYEALRILLNDKNCNLSKNILLETLSNLDERHLNVLSLIAN